MTTEYLPAPPLLTIDTTHQTISRKNARIIARWYVRHYGQDFNYTWGLGIMPLGWTFDPSYFNSSSATGVTQIAEFIQKYAVHR